MKLAPLLEKGFNMSYKQDFVETNPYLVYTPEPDTSSADISSGGGGGGGGGGGDVSEPLQVKIEFDENENADMMDKTAEEILTAYSQGRVIVIYDDAGTPPKFRPIVEIAMVGGFDAWNGSISLLNGSFQYRQSSDYPAHYYD